RLDILVNDIWGAEKIIEWNKPIWEHSLEKGTHLIDLAIKTHLITSHYALPLLIKNKGGLVVEMTDGTLEYNQDHYRCTAYYDLAKMAIIRLAFALDHELKPHGCTAVALTPGWLRSEMMLDGFGVTEDNWEDAVADSPHFAISETPRFVGRAVAALAADPNVDRFAGQSLSSAGLAQVYGFTDIDGSQPDSWRYLIEIQEAGKPADVTGYR
ncbi:MAG: SDR family oxidoreductase, partial [Chloroflexota bacterium]